MIDFIDFGFGFIIGIMFTVGFIILKDSLKLYIEHITYDKLKKSIKGLK